MPEVKREACNNKDRVLDSVGQAVNRLEGGPDASGVVVSLLFLGQGCFCKCMCLQLLLP